MESFQVSIINELIKKREYINTMDYYSIIKEKEVVSFAGKWVELEIIMLNKISKTHKHCKFALKCRI
jgi:hypothetical protein